MVKIINNKTAIKEIYDIEKECFNSKSCYKNIEELIENKNYLILGNFVNDKLVAFLIGIKLQDEYEILQIATKIAYQKNGFATELLKNISNHFDKLFLEVSSNNLIAIKFYKKFGFKQISVRKKYYFDGSDALILVYKNH